MVDHIIQVMKMLIDKANQQENQLTVYQQKIKEHSKTETDMLNARATSEQFSREIKVFIVLVIVTYIHASCFRIVTAQWHC